MILFCASSVQGNYSKGVLIGDWAIDQTEVTIQQFAEFVAVTGLTTRAEKEGGGFEFVGGWQRRSGWAWRSPEGQANADTRLPAVHLTHAEAEDYCRWRGGRLPTHIEWSSAGFTEQREFPPAPFIKGKTYPYPTGDSPSGANTNARDPWPTSAPAGQTQVGVNGLYDIGGNVWEWSVDQRGEERRTLGGSWWYGASRMTSEDQAWKPADFYAVYIGFRCVYVS